ncbi:MAG: N-acetylmuramoyl-L-alanine amidase [Ktedonobacteraceae bacterium]|nr:N-acetylmuramoyl-L-alanine amidase [Ktedonobacteraceae bacterium]
MHEQNALWIPSNNYFRGRSGHTPTWIIIHGTAGFTSTEEVGYYFQQADVATHYIIGQDGTLVCCVDEDDGAWGNGGVTKGHDPWWSRTLNPNLLTISIEHVKPSRDNSDELTAIQKQASFTLIQHICARYNISGRRADAQGGITGHYSMDPVHRSFCPGPYPWDELFTFLNS